MSFNEFQNLCLQAHNDVRKKHDAGPLKLDEKLCKYALEWATKIKNEKNPRGRGEGPYGENVFVSSGMPIAGDFPVEVWYREMQFYDFKKSDYVELAAHFTQLVWKYTKRLGVGRAVDDKDNNRTYVVCNYDPPGNVWPYFEKNVTPAKNAPGRKSKQDGTNSKFSEFQRACLKAHNECRAKHGAGPLELDEKLSKYALEWATKLLKEKRIYHRTEGLYGENIYQSGGIPVDGEFAVKTWYSELQLYNFQKPGFDHSTGHFTQLVWKDSKKVGVAVVVDKADKNRTVVVANYDPPGNVRTKFEQNVLPVKNSPAPKGK